MSLPRISIARNDNERPGTLLVPVQSAEDPAWQAVWPFDRETLEYTEILSRYALRSPRAHWNICKSLGVDLWTLYRLGDNSKPIGFVSLRIFDDPYPELGYMISRKEALGQGMGTLAIFGIAEYALQTQGALGLYATTLEVNNRAQTSLGKGGFKRMSLGAKELMAYGFGGESAHRTGWWLFGPDIDAQHEQWPWLERDVLAAYYQHYEDSKQVATVTLPAAV
jgi:RimJ/RimL family protein N-acetyltransferase